jgi:hypothetical protein
MPLQSPGWGWSTGISTIGLSVEMGLGVVEGHTVPTAMA